MVRLDGFCPRRAHTAPGLRVPPVATLPRLACQRQAGVARPGAVPAACPRGGCGRRVRLLLRLLHLLLLLLAPFRLRPRHLRQLALEHVAWRILLQDSALGRSRSLAFRQSRRVLGLRVAADLCAQAKRRHSAAHAVRLPGGGCHPALPGGAAPRRSLAGMYPRLDLLALSRAAWREPLRVPLPALRAFLALVGLVLPRASGATVGRSSSCS